jgi:hypothetical protein
MRGYDRFRIGSKPEKLTSEHIAPDETLRPSGFQPWAMTDSLRLAQIRVNGPTGLFGQLEPDRPARFCD